MFGNPVRETSTSFTDKQVAKFIARVSIGDVVGSTTKAMLDNVIRFRARKKPCRYIPRGPHV